MDRRAVSAASWMILKALGRFLRFLVLVFLLGFELLFVGYSLVKFVLGGWNEVIGWWWQNQCELAPVEQTGSCLNWWRFGFGHVFIAALTVTLWYFDRRKLKELGSGIVPQEIAEADL